jgi:hypothetical protein
MYDGFSRSDGFAYNTPTPGEPLYPWAPLAPGGWSAYVRPGVFKQIVMISDDEAGCITQGDNPITFNHAGGAFAPPPSPAPVVDFDTALQELSPEDFGTARLRRYRFHSIVGFAADGALGPEDAVVDMSCETAAAPGIYYQELSRSTGGMRFPVCDFESYDAVFNALAERTAGDAILACEWGIPEAPAGETLDPNAVNLIYVPGAGNPARTIAQVPSAASCGEQAGWYYDDPENPTRVLSCPATCAAFEADVGGSVEIGFGCQTVTRDVR